MKHDRKHPIRARTLAATFLLGLTLAAVGMAGPLQKEHIAGDAKWVLHLDLDAMRATQVGGVVAAEIDKKLAKPAADLKEYIDYDFDWRRISALSAYGTGFQPPHKGKGVLLIYTDLDLQKALEAVIEKMQAGTPDKGPVKRLQGDPLPLYLVNNELYVALQPGRPALLSKVEEDVLKARQVLTGQGQTLLASQGFFAFGQQTTPYVCLAMAEGFNESTPIPHQAKVLKMAEAVRATLNESGDRLVLQVALQAKSAEVSQQIQQVVQGLIALVALGQVENQNVQQLAQSTKVTADGKVVAVEVQLPVVKAIKEIQAKAKRRESAEAPAPAPAQP